MKKWLAGRMLESARKRLYARRNVTPSGCWEWTGPRFRATGYAQISYESTPHLAHRVSWLVHRGPIPAGRLVLHRCDNRPCFNPDHLFLGDHQINTDDKIAKGRLRHGHLYGEANPGAKLNWDKAIAIRARCDAGETTYALAQEFGVNQALIWRVWRGRSWKAPPLAA